MRTRRPRPFVVALTASGIVAAAILAGPPPASSAQGLPPEAAITASPNPALVNQTVTFDGSGSMGDGAGGTITTYEWDLDGDPTNGPNADGFETNTGSTPTASRSYATAMTITVRLRVTDSDGDPDEDSVELEVHNPPVASFTFSPSAPLPNQTITFDGSASNDPDGPIAGADHDWDLDSDGAFDDAQGKVITHSFADAGNHTVSLQVTDSDGAKATKPRVVRVNAPPTAGFIVEPSTPAVNEQIAFSSTSSDAEGPIPSGSHRWDFDADGKFDDAVGANVTHAFATAGTMPVSLEVTDSDGATAVASRDVLVQENPPTATFSFSPGKPLSNRTVTFDGSASAPPPGETITTMTWDLDGDGAFDDATGPKASFSYPTPGPRTVSLRVDGSGGGFDITTRVVPVGNRGPAASFDSSPQSPRAGNTVRLISTSADPDGPIVDQAWDLDGDGEFDDASGPTAEKTFSEAGTFTVGLRVRDSNGATDQRMATISVEPRILDLLSPFPVVIFSGELETNGRTRVKRLSVRAPQLADVAVRCRGKSCPFKERALAVESHRVSFPGLERSLQSGVVIEIFVTDPDKVGKFTRFKLRKGKAPKRKDRCLEGERRRPIPCPT